MKKTMIIMLCIIGMMVSTVQAQYADVRPLLVPGVASGEISPSCNGYVANLSCTAATGGDISNYSYQWQLSLNNVTWSNVLGATSLLYTTPALTDTAYYRLQVLNLCNSPAYSNTLTINIFDAFVFVGGVTTISGGIDPSCYNTSAGTMTAPFVIGGAPGTTTQWQSSPDNIAWSNILGATNPTYTTPNLTSTTYYRTQFTNACNVLTSAVKTINVHADFVFVGGITTISGGVDPSCYNTSAGTMTAPTVTGGAPGTITQWQSSPDNITWSNILGATNPTYTTPNLTSLTYYRTQFTNACNVLTSAVKTINVYNNFVFVGGISTISGGTAPLCNMLSAGTMTAPTVIGGAPGTITQWQSSPDNITWSNIPGETNPSYTTPALANTIYYRTQFTNACNVLTSAVKTIIVYAPFDPGIVTFSIVNNDTMTVCYNSAPNPIINLVSPSGGDGIYTYNWVESATNIAPWTPATGVINLDNYQPPILTAPRGFRRNVTNTCGVQHSGHQ